ncbi:MAG TPA: phosphoglycerate kinase [Clostridia bacterium]|nr:phosphoglycerate kinase [Clostridia bacterium]
MVKKTVKDINVRGKRVLTRVDFNVPLNEDKSIGDDTRIRASLPTIRHLVDEGARVILVSHLGRPGGEVVEKLRMDPVASRLGELLGRAVNKQDDCIGPTVQDTVGRMQDGDVLLLENVRFYPGEQKNDRQFAHELASLAELYVNDAFGTAHRAHASTKGVTEFIPGVAGLLLEKELNVLGKLLSGPDKPFVAIIGGAKVADKINILESFLTRVDALLIGGGMANTFLKAKGLAIGKSLVENEKVEQALELMDNAKKSNVRLLLPTDLVVAPAFSPDAGQKIVPVEAIPEDCMALDIGPETIREFTEVIGEARTLFWNGPVGVFEMEPFARGTEALAAVIAKSQAVSVVGGGDSVAALKKLGVTEQITHVSTGGGASMEFLEGKGLPGVEALQDK